MGRSVRLVHILTTTPGSILLAAVIKNDHVLFSSHSNQ